LLKEVDAMAEIAVLLKTHWMDKGTAYIDQHLKIDNDPPMPPAGLRDGGI